MNKRKKLVKLILFTALVVLLVITFIISTIFLALNINGLFLVPNPNDLLDAKTIIRILGCFVGISGFLSIIVILNYFSFLSHYKE